MEKDDLPYLIALARTDAFGANTVRRLLKRFGTAERIWRAKMAALQAAGAGEKSVRKFADLRAEIDPDRETSLVEGAGILPVLETDRLYPECLRQISDPPFLLFVRGRPEVLTAGLSLAFVGTRNMTRYGETAVRMLCRPLAQAGVAVVSGLALGVDAEAHAVSLRADGTTVAVLAGGVDAKTVGPKENAALAERLVESGGALVSEFPPGTRPDRFRFPRRNRIIAGLTAGTVVVEAAERSGALITARCALDAGRDVWAVPGPISQSLSLGTNRLIADGALPAVSAEAIMDHYGLSPFQNGRGASLSESERRVAAAIRREPMTADGLTEALDLSPPAILAALTVLEMAGLAERHGDAYSAKVDI